METIGIIVLVIMIIFIIGGFIFGLSSKDGNGSWLGGILGGAAHGGCFIAQLFEIGAVIAIIVLLAQMCS